MKLRNWFRAAMLGVALVATGGAAEARSSGAHHGYQGGHYSGGSGSSHKGGHYVNSRTNNHYTHH
jgi:hypothetical protein